jgi:hypothetical protein
MSAGSMMLRLVFRACAAVMVAGLVLSSLALSGCQSSPAPQPAPVMAKPGPASLDFSKAPPSQTGKDVSPDRVLPTGESATRLQDIGGYLMLYFREHQAMPDNLSDLANLPGGKELNFNSESGQPFAYQANGMWSPERNNKCIVAYDPELRNGKRWVLFMSLPKTGAPLDVDVYDLPEPFFLNYQP